MLLFIEELSIKSVDKLLFQYISCYCLSAKLHLEGSTYLKFQYISCYCLSWRCLHLYGFPEISIHLMLLFIWPGLLPSFWVTQFQYISCYCLSRCSWRGLAESNISIHLMLLFIRFFCWSYGVFKLISIHLMLLFIDTVEVSCVSISSFQYISCYCLSLPLPKLPYGLVNFNTSHVTVYLTRTKGQPMVLAFQYISCYCLSK